jgi:hypothetical protein
VVAAVPASAPGSETPVATAVAAVPASAPALETPVATAVAAVPASAPASETPAAMVAAARLLPPLVMAHLPPLYSYAHY